MTFPASRPPAVALAFGAVGLAALLTVVGLFLLGLGPFAPLAPGLPPSNSPTVQSTGQPTVGAQVDPTTSASPLPSSAPTQIPAASVAPPTPSTAIDALLPHVPEAIRASCTPVALEPPVLAAVSCTAGGGAVNLSYTLYADQPTMAAIYDSAVVAAGIDDNSGRCYNRDDNGAVGATMSRWPAENGYTIDDESVGRYLCHEEGTTARITWTDDRLYILARATTDRTVVDRMIAFWIDEAGPIASEQ